MSARTGSQRNKGSNEDTGSGVKAGKSREYSTVSEVSGPLMVIEGVEGVAYGEVVQVGMKSRKEPAHNLLVPKPRRGRHEQLSVHQLVPLTIVGERPNHLCCVVHGSGHNHKVTSARRFLQEKNTLAD